MNESVQKYQEIISEHFLLTEKMVSRLEMQIFLDYVSSFKNPRILDVGCGGGRDLLLFEKTGYSLYGVDINEAAITECKNKISNNTILLNKDFHCLDFIDFLTGLWCSFSLTHYPLFFFEKSVRKFKTMLIHDGILFLGLRVGEGMESEWSSELNISRTYYNFTLSEIEKILERYSFEMLHYDCRNEEKEFGIEFRDLDRHFIICKVNK